MTIVQLLNMPLNMGRPLDYILVLLIPRSLKPAAFQ
jgi:hypothetical protein